MTLPKVYLLDGGLGTLLTDKYNITFTNATPLWSSHLLLSEAGRGVLLDAQRSFADAGADVIISATYQASFEGFRNTSFRGLEEGQDFAVLDDDVARTCMRKAVDIAREAFDMRKERSPGNEIRSKERVALSLGAYGAIMVPSTEYSAAYDEQHQTIEQLKYWHLQRLRAFCPIPNNAEENGEIAEESVNRNECWAKVDIVAFETLPARNEIFAVREVMSELPADQRRPFWISCVFPGEGNSLPDGTELEEVIKAMLGRRGRDNMAVPRGIGINCTKVEKLEGLIEGMESAVAVLLGDKTLEWPALVIYPDGTRGEVYNTSAKQWEKLEASGGNNVSRIPQK
jgi:homocysteine S-methyltransferase